MFASYNKYVQLIAIEKTILKRIATIDSIKFIFFDNTKFDILSICYINKKLTDYEFHSQLIIFEELTSL